MGRSHSLLGALVAVALTASTVAGQETSRPFRVEVDLVALNVVVTDPQQKFVSGLTESDFLVFEDGVQQAVSFFAAANVPLDLAILLDTSASMSDKMDTVQRAAIGFASTLRANDRVTIVDIKDATKVIFPLSGDVAGAREAILGTGARGATGLYNGLYLSLKELTRQRRANEELRRQAIVVLSDGEDTSSLMSFDDVMETARQSGIAVFTITLKSQWILRQAAESGRRHFSEADYSMRALAQETGGRAFFPADVSELAGVYGSIADELSSQYALGYTSKNPKRDGAFRRLVVRIAAHPEVRTRTRAGYVAPRPQQAALSGTR